ncbi:DUF1206 domain-containing protein [Halobacillus mangrovi]|uniref:DUF1206 domain-containing protein n=1 Tax=Halobacillus mangrovi TaxID=402384 RepID=UPI003D97A7EE
MSSSMTTSAQAQQTKEEIKPWIRRFGRFGYMAKGAVYGLVGVLAFMAAIGVGGKTTGTSGMLRTLAGVQFGEILLWLIGIGLIGYVIWDFIKAIKNPQNKGAISRIGYAVSGVIYGALALNAIKIAMKAGSSSGNSEQTLSAKLLSQPFGQWVVGAIGIIIIGYGLYELYSGWSERFMKQFKTGQMDRHEQKVARKSGKMGLISRGVVLGLIGFFFVQTAMSANPDQAKGLDGALSELAQTPYGQWLLGVVALGLILYGIYQIIRGRHEHMSFGKIK